MFSWLWCLCLGCRVGEAKRRYPHVILSSDRAQFVGLAAALRSLVRNTGELSVTVVVPAAELSAASKLCRCVTRGSGASVRYATIESTGAGSLPYIGYELYGPAAAAKAQSYGNLSSSLNYARFYVAQLAPAEADYLLYLDVDVIVRCDVALLLAEEAPALFKARPDAVIAAVERGSTRRRNLLFSRTARVFNAGIFVVDVKRWRSTGATAALERLVAETSDALRHNRTALWHRPSSQAPMVVLFGETFAPLDPKWNRPFHARPTPPKDIDHWIRNHNHHHSNTLEAEELGDCVWHFTGPIKPWADDAEPWTRALWDPSSPTEECAALV